MHVVQVHNSPVMQEYLLITVWDVQVLYNMAPRSFTQRCQAVSVASIAASTVRPGDSVPSGKQPPAQVRPRQSHRLALSACL